MFRSLSFSLVILCLILSAHNVQAMFIASLSCDATSCDITPDAGPVSLADPTNFTLDVDWSPEHIELIEPLTDRGEWSMSLLFRVSSGQAINEGDMGEIILNEMGGVGIGDLNIQVDDLNQVGADIRVRYDIFGPDTQGTFFAHGFSLSTSGLNPLTTLTDLEWISARISGSDAEIDNGVWVMPEPTTLALMSMAVAGLGLRRKNTK